MQLLINILLIVAILLLIAGIITAILRCEGLCVPFLTIGTLGTIILTITHCYYYEHFSETVCAKIVSIERGNQTSASFILGTGTIKNTQYYFTYEENDTNTYKLIRLSTFNSYIVETDSGNYHVQHIKNRGLENDYYEIYVPFGTITKEFSL